MAHAQDYPKVFGRYDSVAYILPGFVAGIYASACFGGMVFSEGIRVLYRFPQDSIVMRALVVWVMLTSILHTSWFEYITYHYAVNGFDDMRKLNIMTPHLGCHVFLSRVLVTTSQLFFCHRLYIFSSRNWRGTSVAIMLTVGHVAAAIVTMIRFVEAKLYSELELTVPLGVLYSTTIAGDILITGSLLYYLAKQKTYYLKTKSIIKRIMLLSFQTSFLTTALAIVSIGLLAGQRELGILYCLTLISAQLYLLSILVTLNSRFDFAKAFAEDANKSLSKSFRMNFLKTKAKEWPLRGDGVSIQVDQVVYTDFDQDLVTTPRFAKVRSGNGQEEFNRGPAVPVLNNFAQHI